MLNLTAGMRFDGALNVDINEITMNLVPFPTVALSAVVMSPGREPADRGSRRPRRGRWTRYSPRCSGRDRQLASVDPRRSTYLACALLMRGAVNISDANRNVDG